MHRRCVIFFQLDLHSTHNLPGIDACRMVGIISVIPRIGHLATFVKQVLYSICKILVPLDSNRFLLEVAQYDMAH